jgi:RNA polymerase primary sigma factor
MMNDEFNEITRRLASLEHHIINLIIPIQNICEIFKDTNRLNDLINLLNKPLKVDTSHLETSSKMVRESSITFQEEIKSLDLKKTFDEIRFIGKRLNEIEITLGKLQKDGVSQNIQLDFTMDGHRMVKKPLNHDVSETIEDPNKNLKKLLDTLTDRESKIIIHRIGLFGVEKKTLKEIGKIFNITSEPIRQGFNKAIRKLRHPSRKKLMQSITNVRLKKHVYGEVLL